MPRKGAVITLAWPLAWMLPTYRGDASPTSGVVTGSDARAIYELMTNHRYRRTRAQTPCSSREVRLIRGALRTANTVRIPAWHGMRQENRATSGAIWGTTGGKRSLRYGRSELHADDLRHWKEKHWLTWRQVYLMFGYRGITPFFGLLPIWAAIRLDILRSDKKAYRSAYESSRRGYVWGGREIMMAYCSTFYPWEWR